MISHELEKCIIRFLSNEASQEDIQKLSLWIKNIENQELFEQYVKTHHEITIGLENIDIKTLQQGLLKEINQTDKNEKTTKRIWFSNFIKYAAIFIIMMSFGYVFVSRLNDKSITSTSKEDSTEQITIESENGTKQILDPNGKMILKNSQGKSIGRQEGEKLVYNAPAKAYAVSYNTIYIPHGKQFNLILSDGTTVYLNAGSSLRYPTQFEDGRPREVTLKGEAFFDVVKNTKKPFIVHSDSLNITVLGTKFNVTNYPENKSVHTTLVEGSVSLSQKNNNTSTLLEPGYKAEWGKDDYIVNLESVDTEIYTAWIHGKLIFKNTSFKRIRLALERKYNVLIKNNNKDLDNERFDASFDIETIDDVLQSFTKSYPFEYKLNNDRITIN